MGSILYKFKIRFLMHIFLQIFIRAECQKSLHVSLLNVETDQYLIPFSSTKMQESLRSKRSTENGNVDTENELYVRSKENYNKIHENKPIQALNTRDSAKNKFNIYSIDRRKSRKLLNNIKKFLLKRKKRHENVSERGFIKNRHFNNIFNKPFNENSTLMENNSLKEKRNFLSGLVNSTNTEDTLENKTNEITRPSKCNRTSRVRNNLPAFCFYTQYFVYSWILCMVALASFLKLNYWVKICVLLSMVITYCCLLIGVKEFSLSPCER